MFRLIRLTAILFLVASTLTVASDWPHLRGPATDGRVPAAGTFEGEDIGLELAWRAPLGSAYSGVAVAGGRVVTMFADGESDLVAAFDAGSGKELWRYRLSEMTKGHDGSDDGPLSSPVIADGQVYALGADGLLHALKLADGKAVWTRNLKEEMGAKQPYFGFTTAPLVVDGKLIVQAGGSEGRSIVALDAKNGKTLWSQGEGQIDYQSPTLMTLAGTPQIVAVSKTEFVGLSPKDGTLLWSHPMGEKDRANSATPTPAGDDRFVVLMSGGATVFEVSHGEAGWAVAELYRTETLGQNYTPPVYHDGHLYGFRGQVLTCIKAADGDRVWRSRPPGGDGLILVDGHLVIFGAKGNVVIAAATPDGYEERARVQALEGSSLTWPAFADGRVIVRNLSEIAAVSITAGRGAAPVVSSLPADHAFGSWLRETRKSDNAAARVDALFEEHPTMPWIEGEYVHFLYRGDATEVSIAGSMLEAGTPESMHRLEGTDLFYRTYHFEPGSRWEYQYQVDYETWMADPLNEDRVPTIEGEEEVSQVRLAGYAVSDASHEPDAVRGRMESFTLASEKLGGEKEIQVWLPPGYDDGEAEYPLLLVNDGKTWLDKGLLDHSLENLVGKSVQPVVAVFVPAAGRWWLEAGGGQTAQYIEMQVEELLPMLHEKYRLQKSKGAHAVMGNRFYAFTTLYAALEHPEVFGHASLQSVYTGLGNMDGLLALIDARAGASVDLYLDWNRYDERNIDREWDMGRDSRELAARLEESGYSLRGGERLDSAGWGGWRNRTGEVLAGLFPLER